jgi:hypothetical protein
LSNGTRNIVGNVVLLEHVNTTIPDQQLATIFYVSGLGLTRDPYLMTGTENMWINIGRSQFHMPTATPQLVRGRIGLVVPDLAALARRLTVVSGKLSGTRFEFAPGDDHVDAISPWGNRYRCHAPDARFGPGVLGLTYLELDVPKDTADGVARFYREVLEAPAATFDGSTGRGARVTVGPYQHLLFLETDRPIADYDGHHIQIYVAQFDTVYQRLGERGLVTEVVRAQQYRFENIVDPASGSLLYRLEHEVRSTAHPLYNRPLVNRNAAQTNMNYVPGNDALRL